MRRGPLGAELEHFTQGTFCNPTDDARMVSADCRADNAFGHTWQRHELSMLPPLCASFHEIRAREIAFRQQRWTW